MSQGKRDNQLEASYKILFFVIIGILACLFAAFLTDGMK